MPLRARAALSSVAMRAPTSGTDGMSARSANVVVGSISPPMRNGNTATAVEPRRTGGAAAGERWRGEQLTASTTDKPSVTARPHHRMSPPIPARRTESMHRR